MSKTTDLFTRLVPRVLEILDGMTLTQNVKLILTTLVLGQIPIETAWGASRACQPPHNNWSGIKYHLPVWGAWRAGTFEVVNGADVKQPGLFQNYPSFEDWLKDYIHIVISRPCVMDAMASGWEAVADTLGPWTASDHAKMAAGQTPDHANYSTNPDYPELVKEIVQERHLDDAAWLDWYSAGANPATEPAA